MHLISNNKYLFNVLAMLDQFHSYQLKKKKIEKPLLTQITTLFENKTYILFDKRALYKTCRSLFSH